MENNRKENESKQQDGFQHEKNETLQKPGAAVADYGNVSGGSATSNEEQDKNNSSRSGENASDTIGNP